MAKVRPVRLLALVAISGVAVLILWAFAAANNTPLANAPTIAFVPISPGPQTSDAGHGLTEGGYGAVKPGMGFAQVSAALGGPGEEMSVSEVGGVRDRVVQWGAADNPATMTVVFQNDHVISKAKVGF